MGKRAREKKERRNEIEKGERKEVFVFQSGLEKACLFIVRWGTYLVLFTPLIISTNFFFPFVAPKTIFFRIIIEIIFAAYIFLLLISNSRYRPRITALTISVILFLGIFILASFTGINFERSFWSTNERMTGIWTMLHLFVFFIVLGSVFKKREDWEKILGVSVIVGVFLSLFILFGKEISSRGGGTIGNTSFMAAYLLFDIFFAVILFLAKDRNWKIFSGLSLIAMIPVLLTSSARGAIIFFFGGLFLLFLGYLFFSQKKAFKRLAFGIVLVLVISGITLAFFQPSFIKSEAETTLKDMNSRFVVWEKGLKGFLERPVIGWGPENFNVVFNKYFNPCMFLNECGGEIWFDRVHNIVFDTLVTMGITGLLIYLSMFGVAIYGLFKILPKITERKNIFIPLGLIVLLIVYFAQNLLVFDMINTYLVFFLSLAFINFLIKEDKNTTQNDPRIKSVNPFLSFVVVLMTIFFLWAGNIHPLIANNYIIKTIGVQEIGESNIYFQKSLKSWMNEYETREYFSQKVTKIIYESGQDEKATQEAFVLAEAEMEKSIEQNYLDFRPHLFLGELYNSSYQFSGDKEKLEKAEQVLEKAIILAPTNQQGYWNLAETKVALGKLDEAISLLQEALELEPRIGYSYWYLAMAYKIAGKYQLSEEEIVKAKENGFHWEETMDYLKRVIDIYFALGDDVNLVSLYKQAIELDPQNTQLWAALAASYANLGQYKEAKEAANKVLEIDPELKDSVEEFLRSISYQ
ncbi:MAG: O-antigen ligase family protein [Candidatus Nealsonbacteria bacterium]